MRQSRGRELPGMFNPLIVAELFIEQCQPWKGLAAGLKEGIVQAVYPTTRETLKYASVDETTDGIFRIVARGINQLEVDLTQKVEELLEPHLEGHPITYNH